MDARLVSVCRPFEQPPLASARARARAECFFFDGYKKVPPQILRGSMQNLRGSTSRDPQNLRVSWVTPAPIDLPVHCLGMSCG